MISDPIKAAVLNKLLEDASLPRKQIATDLGISESYVSKIVKDLSKYDPYITRFTVEVNYRKAGYDAHAITLMKLRNVNKDESHSIVERIAKLDGCVEVYTALGDWDIYIRWLCRSNAEVMSGIDQIIDSSLIADSVTLPLAVQYKRVIGPKVSVGD